jgi:hypothetical protein
VHRSGGLRWHDIHTKFHDDRFGHLKVGDSHTDTQTAR